MNKRFWGLRVAGVVLGLLVLCELCAFCGSASAADPVVLSVGVKGNERVSSEYILGLVEIKPGDTLERDRLQSDIEAIYNQGFFSFVDADLTTTPEGVEVAYSIMENPVVEEITFEGNTIYTSETLMEEVFTMVGSVFNRVFFRNDLDRIQERYRRDGYVMVRVADVDIQGGIIKVNIVEPRIGEIIIQGNSKTKTYVIRREIKLDEGDLFNVNQFRHQLGVLQGKGYFEDVNVGFDVSEEDPDVLNLVLTVKEQKTQSIGINVGYGTESGFSGGLTYADTNFAGLGHQFDVGFDIGDDARYWITYSSPYMDNSTYGWRAGFTYRDYIDQYYYSQETKRFEYDETSLLFYGGLGKRFGRQEEWSWFFTLNWRDTNYTNRHAETSAFDPDDENDIFNWGGKNFSSELLLTLDQRVPYIPYQKGLVWDTTLESAFELLGGEYSYLKYWTQARYYMPISGFLDGVVDVNGLWSEENPIILAARLRVGSSTEDELPVFARYALGGMNSLRGYRSRTFEGSNVLLGNLELRIPIQQNFEIVGFYDVGNAGDNMDWGDLNDNYGFGVRVRTPMGLLRLDYATGGEENRTYFGFGEMF